MPLLPGICDDERASAEKLYLTLEPFLREEEEIIYEFSNGVSAANWLAKHPGEMELLFLDVGMEPIDGIQTAERIRTFDRDIFLVFVTGHEEFALHGYRVNASDYGKLSDLEKELPHGFVRIHNRYIVNADWVGRVNGNKVITEGRELPVSRSMKQEAVSALARMILEKRKGGCESGGFQSAPEKPGMGNLVMYSVCDQDHYGKSDISVSEKTDPDPEK